MREVQYCRHGPSGKSGTSPQGLQETDLNLLLISIDSLRLDYVGRTNPKIRTPRFDHLTRHYRFYERFFSVSSATRPVHTTLFTGLYPFEHGILGQHYPRVRKGISHLFELFREKRYAVGAFSEVPQIFANLGFGIKPLRWAPRFLRHNRSSPKCLFLHYWSAHTPYGATDGRAMGETAQLLSAGQIQAVVNRYTLAIHHLFEHKLAPLLEHVDPQNWCVIILSDHGESWSREEPYHGQTLRNSVLRIPLYFHFPGSGNPPPPRPLLSIVDLFPTLVQLFQLPVNYQGYGLDIRQEIQPNYYLAQIHPTFGEDTRSPYPRRTHPRGDRQWAVFDVRGKFTYNEDRRESRLEDPLTEEPLDGGDSDRYKAAYKDMQTHSAYVEFSSEPFSEEEKILLQKRLQDLGYI